MNVGLSVRKDDDFFPVQMLVQCRLQSRWRPLSGSIFLLSGHSSNQFPHIAQDGLKLSTLLSPTAQQATQFERPVVTRPPGYKKRDAESCDGQDPKDDNQKRSRPVLAPLDVAEVLDHDHEAEFPLRS